MPCYGVADEFRDKRRLCGSDGFLAGTALATTLDIVEPSLEAPWILNQIVTGWMLDWDAANSQIDTRRIN
jgi:hypothetical protein